MNKLFLTGALGLALFSTSPARAQGGMPDMSDFAGVVAKKAQAAPPKKAAPTPKTGFASGLVVPRVKPGQAARGIFTQLRQQTEAASKDQADMAQVLPALKELEEQAPALLSSIEKELLTKYGFATRDMGTAYAFSFLTLLEAATGRKTTDVQDKAAGRTLSSAVGTYWAARWKTMTPAAKEQAYESLIMSTALSSLLIEQFDKVGKTQEVAALRASAGETFQKLVGVAPQGVKIAADGRISGLSR